MKDTFGQVIRLGLCITALAVVLYAIDALYYAPKRMPLCVQEELPEGHICLERVMRDWADPQHSGHYKVVWVDARSENDYELHHLMLNDERMFPIRPGVDMQPLLDAAIERLAEAEALGECIVVFCTRSCNASSEVAAELRATGVISAPVFVLEGGWDALKNSSFVGD